jgi:hypothetical protein
MSPRPSREIGYDKPLFVQPFDHHATPKKVFFGIADDLTVARRRTSSHSSSRSRRSFTGASSPPSTSASRRTTSASWSTARPASTSKPTRRSGEQSVGRTYGASFTQPKHLLHFATLYALLIAATSSKCLVVASFTPTLPSDN